MILHSKINKRGKYVTENPTLFYAYSKRTKNQNDSIFGMKKIVIFLSFFFLASCATNPAAPQSVQETKLCRITAGLQKYRDFSSCFDGENPDGTLKVRSEIILKLKSGLTDQRWITYADFSRTQPASRVYSSSVVGYILPNGKARDVIFFETGPDYFQEGFARFISQNGKTGYVDETLRLVIPPAHDFASPFDGGQAYFCDGCKSVSDGEKPKIVGGFWGIMDKKGKTLKKPEPYEKFFSIKK